MSIPVRVEDLAEALADFGDGYLLTTAGQSIKAVTVSVTLRDGLLRTGSTSRGSAANLERNAAATLVFPPREARGLTLLVDGTARATGDGIELTPQSAILHRPASHADELPAAADGQCGNDCRHL